MGAAVSIRIEIEVSAQIESGYGESKFVRVTKSRLVLPEIAKATDVGLTAAEQLKALLTQLSTDAVREAQEQTDALGQHYHRTVHAHQETPDAR